MFQTHTQTHPHMYMYNVSLCTHHTLQVRKVHNVSLTRSITSTVQSVELKLLFIPIFFILLRIWSLIFGIIEIEAHAHLNCAAVLFFLHMGVSRGVWV